MSEISETEIKAMTKEQNYIRGYKDGKSDVLDKIRAEIEQVKSIMNEEIINHDRKDLINFVNGLNQSLVIIDKYTEEEIWEGIHAQVTAPKGTFDKIWNEAEDNDEI